MSLGGRLVAEMGTQAFASKVPDSLAQMGVFDGEDGDVGSDSNSDKGLGHGLEVGSNGRGRVGAWTDFEKENRELRTELEALKRRMADGDR